MSLGVELDSDYPSNSIKPLKDMGKFDQDADVRDLEATIRLERERSGRKVGVVGYCFGSGLDDHPRVTLLDYPGEGHCLATRTCAWRSPEAAELADRRTAEFFAQHLA